MDRNILIPGLPNRIVEEHIMPKIMKPILDIEVKVSKITMATLKVDLSTIICIFKYKGVNRDWARYISRREEYNSMRLSMHEQGVDYGHKFEGTRGVGLLYVLVRKFVGNLLILRTTQRIAMPIMWTIQHASLCELSLQELKYLRNKLFKNRVYWRNVARTRTNSRVS